MTFLQGAKVYLREVQIEDVNDDYYVWMNDWEINRYMETHFFPQGKETICAYAKEHIGKSSEPWWAICERETDRHVGNIKLGPINYYHRTADVSYFIGDKKCWGKGYGKEALSLVTAFAFEVLNLEKIMAGAYAPNIASQKMLETTGFRCEATFRKQVYFEGRRIDTYEFGLTREDYEAWKEGRRV
ncbi:acetyltransferase, GNAT family [Selenomonas sp. oral taxon 137 str. F0430]|uniref:GNAT family N-acetyltransferase n=1 Tax=Selenomonas sp. oral taxon 137 TaxID=712531 RepID=UPI0001EB2275|nr:GNAT family protein [Selenomonas sp. oral taxon 137]EFR41689.1 acetyltransferase, GNAT family [Selenomonas sp. oral taxon 137 str. F0430]